MNTASPERAEIALDELLRGAWRDRFWVAGIVLAFVAAAVVVGAVQTRVYRATVIAVPAESEKGAGGIGGLLGQLGGVASAVGIDLPAAGNHFEALALLESRGFLAEFVRARGMVPILYGDRWDAAAGGWKPGAIEPTLDDAARRFGERMLVVSEDKRTGIITISVEWSDRVQAAEWANGVVTALNAELRRRSGEQAHSTLAYLESELERTQSVEMREVLYKIVESQLRARMLANVRQEFALKVVDSARVPGAHEVVRPRRVMLLALGIVLGGFLGLVLTAGRTLARRNRA